MPTTKQNLPISTFELSLYSSSCAGCMVRPNKSKFQSLKQREVYCRATPGEWTALAQKNRTLQWFSERSFYRQSFGWGLQGVNFFLVGWEWNSVSLTLCGLTDCSPLGPSVHEIFQARVLEWVTIPFLDLGIESGSPVLQVDSSLAEPSGKSFDWLVMT